MRKAPTAHDEPSSQFASIARRATTKTGLRLAYDDTVVPRNASDEPFPVADDQRFDGISPNSQIRFFFESSVDPQNLPPIDDLNQSIANGCPTVLLRADTGERWMHFSEGMAFCVKGKNCCGDA